MIEFILQMLPLLVAGLFLVLATINMKKTRGYLAQIDAASKQIDAANNRIEVARRRMEDSRARIEAANERIRVAQQLKREWTGE